MGRMPRVGDMENTTLSGDLNASISGGRKYKHNKQQAPKQLDKLRGDYEKKKKKWDAAKEAADAAAGNEGGRKPKNEIRNNEDIRKARNLKEKRREKNARPSKKGRGGFRGRR